VWEDASPTPGYEGTIDGSYVGCTPEPDIAGHDAWSGVIPGGAWTQVTVDVPPALRTADFRFRFLFGADEATTDLGWYIDDVAVSIR
jgi:hypothetical protein